jgi:ubiquinone biosynthesis protein Coq4
LIVPQPRLEIEPSAKRSALELLIFVVEFLSEIQEGKQILKKRGTLILKELEVLPENGSILKFFEKRLNNEAILDPTQRQSQ